MTQLCLTCHAEMTLLDHRGEPPQWLKYQCRCGRVSVRRVPTAQSELYSIHTDEAGLSSEQIKALTRMSDSLNGPQESRERKRASRMRKILLWLGGAVGCA